MSRSLRHALTIDRTEAFRRLELHTSNISIREPPNDVASSRLSAHNAIHMNFEHCVQRVTNPFCHAFHSASPHRLCTRSASILLSAMTLFPFSPFSPFPPFPRLPHASFHKSADIPQNISPRPSTSPARISRYPVHSSPSPPARAT